jgi:hypothetical protein
MKKTTTLILGLVLMTSFASLGVAQVGTSSMQGQRAAPGTSAVEIKVVNAKGQAIKPESLPKDVQANLAQVRKAAESLATNLNGGEAAQKFNITVKCSYPPFNCTITLSL